MHRSNSIFSTAEADFPRQIAVEYPILKSTLTAQISVSRNHLPTQEYRENGHTLPQVPPLLSISSLSTSRPLQLRHFRTHQTVVSTDTDRIMIMTTSIHIVISLSCFVSVTWHRIWLRNSTVSSFYFDCIPPRESLFLTFDSISHGASDCDL